MTLRAGGYVVLRGEHPDLRIGYAAQSTDEAVISVDSVSTDCLCRAETNGRQVPPGERCAAGETRSCIVIIGARPLAAGDASIDVTDDRGTFVQRLPVHVGAASTIEALVHSAEVPRGPALAPAADGLFEVRVGQLVSVAPLVRDASGRELHFTGTEDVTLEAARDGVLSEGEPLSAGYSGRAERVGDSFVTISAAGGVEQTVPFRVIP